MRTMLLEEHGRAAAGTENRDSNRARGAAPPPERKARQDHHSLQDHHSVDAQQRASGPAMVPGQDRADWGGSEEGVAALALAVLEGLCALAEGRDGAGVGDTPAARGERDAHARAGGAGAGAGGAGGRVREGVGAVGEGRDGARDGAAAVPVARLATEMFSIEPRCWVCR